MGKLNILNDAGTHALTVEYNGSTNKSINVDYVAGITSDVQTQINTINTSLSGKLDTSANGIVLPQLSSDPSSANSTVGQMYFNTTDNVAKTYDGSQWRNAGNAPVYTDTFDYLQDGSAVSLHRFNNSLLDSGGVYNATAVDSPFTTTAKFGSHAIDCMGDGDYVDIPGLPRIYAVSIWYYCVGSDNGYIVDFRHDNPSNGRSYLYTQAGGGDQHIDWGDDTTTTGRTGDMWINGQVYNSGQYNFYSGNWYHVVCSYNGGGDVNHQIWDQGIRIGNRSDNTTSGNAGYFDQVRTFNRPLTQTDVDKLYAEAERP